VGEVAIRAVPVNSAGLAGVEAAALHRQTTSGTTIFLFEACIPLAPVAERAIRGAILRQASST
jgi:hypothetical protein